MSAPVDLKALASSPDCVDWTQQSQVIAALRIAVEALQKARSQISRGEWSSHTSGTWVIVNDALRDVSARVKVEP